jgi:hypothetical protein
MILMHLVGVWHAIVTRIESSDSDLAKEMDNWMFIIFVLVFSLFNIGFAVVMIYRV